MTILSLEIEHFGKFKNKKIELRPAVNVITGEEGSGKSTIAAFVRCMLYGMTEEEQESYFPYDFDGHYGGHLRFSADGVLYDLERDFIGEGSMVLRMLPDETEQENPEEKLALLTGGISREEFRNFLCIPKDFFGDTGSIVLSGTLSDEDSEKLKFRNSAVRLQKEREHFAASLEKDPEGDRKEQEQLLRENEEQLREAKEAEAQAESVFREKEDRLREDLLAVRQKNEARQEAFLSDIAEEKQKLQEIGEIDEAALRKSTVPGVVFMAAGMLLGIAVYFFYSRFAGSLSEQRNLLIITFGAGGAAALFIAGIILTGISAFRKTAVLRLVERRKEQKKKAEEAEARYQRYLENRDAVDDRVPDREEREREVREAGRRLEELVSEEKQLSSEHARLTALISRLDDEIADQRQAEKEIRAIDIAMESFRNLSGKDPAELPLSESATKMLSELTEENGQKICVYTDGRVFLERDGIRRSLSELSEETAAETMFAIRLSEALDLDREALLPLILDEVFSRMNSEQTLRIFSALRNMKRQILILSAR